MLPSLVPVLGLLMVLSCGRSVVSAQVPPPIGTGRHLVAERLLSMALKNKSNQIDGPEVRPKFVCAFVQDIEGPVL